MISPECVILIGLPGAGKTMLYRERFAGTHVQVSQDLQRPARRGGAAQEEAIEETLRAGRSVVVDNTNPTVAGRAAIIGRAHRRGARVIGYFFDLPTRVAVARNAERTGSARVPNVAIFTTAKRLQPPTRSEGFDELYRVTIDPDRSLKVEPW